MYACVCGQAQRACYPIFRSLLVRSFSTLGDTRSKTTKTIKNKKNHAWNEKKKKYKFAHYNLCVMREIAPSLKEEALRSTHSGIDVDLIRATTQHDELAEALLATGCGKYASSTTTSSSCLISSRFISILISRFNHIAV